MPIYEYFCRDCNTVYQFFSRTVAPEKDPSCPKNFAHAPLERMLSGFAAPRGIPQTAAGGTSIDDGAPRRDGALESLMGKMQDVGENDPKAMGQLMRQMMEMTGDPADPAVQEVVRRLEDGEDPERVEELMSEALGEDGETDGGGSAGGGGAPFHDPGMYEM